MQYNFDKLINRNNTWSIKHDFKKEYNKPDDVLPLWVADMDFQSPEGVRKALENAVSHGVFGYTKADEKYYRAVCNWYSSRFHWTPEYEWLVCTPGVVFALSMALRTFTKEGDGVVIQPPVYHPFERAILRNNRKLAANPLVLRDGHYKMDLEQLEKTIVENNASLMILCNPHNPVGRVWTREELESLSRICLKYNVFVISDEIHGDFVWPGHVQTPYASLSEDAASHCMICTAPSKTFNLAGLQTSNIFIPNPVMRRRFASALLDVGQENINRMGLIACEAAYRDGAEWLEQLISYLHGNLELLRDFTQTRMPEIKLIEPEGTYLAWLDCRSMNMSDDELEHFFSQKAHVWLDPGVHSGSFGSGFMRFNLGSPRSVIKEALSRIGDAWDSQKNKTAEKGEQYGI